MKLGVGTILTANSIELTLFLIALAVLILVLLYFNLFVLNVCRFVFKSLLFI